MITNQLPLCERCRRCIGRPYQVHWGTLERRPLRDDQESGGGVIIQNGYRIDGMLTVSLCDRCAYRTYDVRLILARARWVIVLVLIASPIWLTIAVAYALPFWILVTLYHVLVIALITLQVAYHRGWLPRRRPMSADYHACDLARARGRIPRWAVALTRAQLAKLSPPDAAGVRWARV